MSMITLDMSSADLIANAGELSSGIGNFDGRMVRFIKTPGFYPLISYTLINGLLLWAVYKIVRLLDLAIIQVYPNLTPNQIRAKNITLAVIAGTATLLASIATGHLIGYAAPGLLQAAIVTASTALSWFRAQTQPQEVNLLPAPQRQEPPQNLNIALQAQGVITPPEEAVIPVPTELVPILQQREPLIYPLIDDDLNNSTDEEDDSDEDGGVLQTPKSGKSDRDKTDPSLMPTGFDFDGDDFGKDEYSDEEVVEDSDTTETETSGEPTPSVSKKPTPVTSRPTSPILIDRPPTPVQPVSPHPTTPSPLPTTPDSTTPSQEPASTKKSTSKSNSLTTPLRKKGNHGRASTGGTGERKTTPDFNNQKTFVSSTGSAVHIPQNRTWKKGEFPTQALEEDEEEVAPPVLTITHASPLIAQQFEQYVHNINSNEETPPSNRTPIRTNARTSVTERIALFGTPTSPPKPTD